MGKALPAKHAIKPNIFVNSTLDVMEATDQAFKTYVGVRKHADTAVPVGTRIYLNPDQPPRQSDGAVELLYITVQQIEEVDGKPLHQCTPIQRETIPERRKTPRTPTDFVVQQAESAVPLIAQNATPSGMQLICKTPQPVLTVNLGQPCALVLTHREQAYPVETRVHYLHYDWKTLRHRMGVSFSSLSAEQETIVNLLIDPNYKVEIKGTQTVDPSLGKISHNI